MGSLFTKNKETGNFGKNELDHILDAIEQEINEYESNERKFTNENMVILSKQYVLLSSSSLYNNIITNNYYYKKRRNKYNITITNKELGNGATSRVLLCFDDRNKRNKYALKEIQDFASFKREINLLKNIKHQNIIKYEYSYYNKMNKSYYILLEYLNGGTLLHRIVKNGYFSENICKIYIKQLLNGISFLHSLGVIHQDLKCKNILFANKQISCTRLKIIDFGNSIFVPNDNKNYCVKNDKIVGSLHYLPPEILNVNIKNRNISQLKKGDIWCVGIICFIMLTGNVPFGGKNKYEVIRKIMKGKYKVKNYNLTAECVNFMSKLLSKDVNSRFDAKQALDHTWIA